MSVLKSIILAAGDGTRMKSDLPKVLHPICGRPMIAYSLSLAASAGVKQPIVVIGHGAEAVKDGLPKEVKPVVQSQRRGTADAVLASKRALGALIGDVLILYADTPLLRRTTVQHLIESHRKTSATCTLLTTHLADPSGYGRIVRDATGPITDIVEEGQANVSQRAIREINVGPMVCKAQALMDAVAAVKPTGTKQELYLTHTISYLARQEGTKIHSIRVEETSEALGVNSRADLARAIGVVRQRIIALHLRNGVTIEDPQSTFIDQGVTIGHDTVIRSHTVIEAGVSIGRRCSIGPFARLRSGVSIADEVRVGNFVELVRSKIAHRVRINHVTYLGDTTVDEGANIGAGSITANYDGTNKHATRIGKGAFIGSDTVLIAPVSIGPGAITGAGSVVPRAHDVPAKGIVVGVPARTFTPAVAKDGRSAKGAKDKRAAEGKPAAAGARPDSQSRAEVTKRTHRVITKQGRRGRAIRLKRAAQKARTRRTRKRVVVRRRTRTVRRTAPRRRGGARSLRRRTRARRR